MSQACGKDKPRATGRPSCTHLTVTATQLEQHGAKAGREQAPKAMNSFFAPLLDSSMLFIPILKLQPG